MDLPVQIDEDCLAGRDIALGAMARSLERHGLAGDHHLGAVGRLAEHQGPNAVWIAKRQQSMARDQRDDGVRALQPAVHGLHGVEHIRRLQNLVAPHTLDLVRQHVDQHLGVAGGIDVAAIDVEQFLLERRGIGQVAVVHQHDAVRRVDVERLRFLFVERVARGRVANLAEPHRSGQAAHVARAKDVAHHAARLVHEALGALHRDDAGRVLAAVLQQQQRVVDQLVDGRLRYHADDAAHGGVLAW
jgi:hypothetical protein